MVLRPLQNLGGNSPVVYTLGWPQRDLTIVGNSLPTQNKLIGSPTSKDLESFGLGSHNNVYKSNKTSFFFYFFYLKK